METWSKEETKDEKTRAASERFREDRIDSRSDSHSEYNDTRYNMQLIQVGDRMYSVVRTIKDSYVRKIDGWKATMLELYNADNVYAKDGVLYVVRTIDDAVVVDGTV